MTKSKIKKLINRVDRMQESMKSVRSGLYTLLYEGTVHEAISHEEAEKAFALHAFKITKDTELMFILKRCPNALKFYSIQEAALHGRTRLLGLRGVGNKAIEQISKAMESVGIHWSTS